VDWISFRKMDKRSFALTETFWGCRVLRRYCENGSAYFFRDFFILHFAFFVSYIYLLIISYDISQIQTL